MSFQYILQNQKIAESKKTKEWDKNHVLQYVHNKGSIVNNYRRELQLKAWKYYYGVIDQEIEGKVKMVTNPYGYSMGLEYTVYPLIASLIEQVVGEYITRPTNRKVYVINKRAKTKKLDDKYAMITEEILREANAELSEAMGFTPDTPNPDMELPEDIEEFFENGDYKTESEEVSDIILRQVLDVKGNADRIKDLLVDLLVQDDCIADVTKGQSHPVIERCDVFETEIDWDPEKEIQDDPQFIIKSKFLSFNEILNTYDLSKEEEAELMSYASINMNSSFAAEDGFDMPGSKYNYTDWFRRNEGNPMRVRCTEMRWISKREVRAKVSKNKHNGKDIYKIIPEDYKVKDSDNIQSIWIDYKRHVFMIGPNLVLEHGPVLDKKGEPERYSFIDQPKKDTLSVVALRRNSFVTTQLNSMAYKLIQLQEMASECLWEMRLAMRRNTGRVLVYDASQIPKQFLKSGGYHNALNRVMHHAKKDQFLIINSQDKQARHAFNQFTSLDMSTRGMMQDMMNMLVLIENLASKFVGVSQERAGNVGQYQSATGTDQAVVSSTARTEVYLNPFESFIEAVLKKVLMVAKYVYEENEVTQYVFGDLKTKFFKVYPSFYQDDIGVSIGSQFQEKRKKDIIDRAAEQAFTNANTPELILNLIEVLEAETSIESKKVLKRGIAAMSKMAQENQKALAEQNQQQLASKENIEANKDGIEKLKIKKDIVVAQIREAGEGIRQNKELIHKAGVSLMELEQEIAAPAAQPK